MYKVIALLVSGEETKSYIVRNLDDYSIHKWSRELLVSKTDAGEVVDVSVEEQPSANGLRKIHGCNNFTFDRAERVGYGAYDEWEEKQLVKDECITHFVKSSVENLEKNIRATTGGIANEIDDITNEIDGTTIEIRELTDEVAELRAEIEELKAALKSMGAKEKELAIELAD